MNSKCLWQILVPTERRLNPGKYYTTRFHRVWDSKVREITGGLTINPPVNGQWVNPVSNELFVERMIPVLIVATRSEIDKIIDLTIKYYDQLAVICFKISDEIIIKYKE